MARHDNAALNPRDVRENEYGFVCSGSGAREAIANQLESRAMREGEETIDSGQGVVVWEAWG